MSLAPATAKNPANEATAAAPKAERKRIPMSVPRRTLEVPDVPGYHLHWFVDRNLARAQQAGYEFVTEEDGIALNQHGVGNSTTVSGTVGMGSQIKAVGGEASGGGTEYLTLMKIKQEWWLEDQRKLEEANGKIMSAIFRDEKIVEPQGISLSEKDRDQRYVKQALFQRPTRKGDK